MEWWVAIIPMSLLLAWKSFATYQRASYKQRLIEIANGEGLDAFVAKEQLMKMNDTPFI